VDALAVRGKHIQAVADVGGVADAEDGGGGVAGGEGEGELGAVEAEVGEGLVVAGEVLDGEAGLVLQQLQAVEDGADGVFVGGPLEGFGEEPGIAVALQAVAAAGGQGDLEGADVGGFGAEDEAAGLAEARPRCASGVRI
jgi:hypothetical protein